MRTLLIIFACYRLRSVEFLKAGLIEYQQLSIAFSLAFIFLAFIVLQDSGDDDDQGGGLMQPVYQGYRNHWRDSLEQPIL